MKIGIINNGLGNVASVYSAFEFYDYDLDLVDSCQGLKRSDLLVLSGVGNFKAGMSALKNLRLLDTLSHEVLTKKKPILGICLGMQLFADVGHEYGQNRGLGWIEGEIIKMRSIGVRIPHTGWDLVEPIDKEFFKGVHYHYFYYMHSYHFLPYDKKIVKAITRYGDIEIVSVLRKDNIIGVQFHPEKSQGDGLRFLRNVVEMIK